VDAVRRRNAKRALDLVVATTLLVVLTPAVVLVLLAFALDSLLVARDRGGLFYREPRISRGRTFGLLKFRTLRRDVLERAGGHARPHEADSENLTWVGRRVLKPWYADEIPQLLNVLRGDISLVGPRPWPPHMVERQRAEGLTYRDEVAAGLTGLAQISKGSGRQFADLDLVYVDRLRRLSGWALLRYDLGILGRTIVVIARRQGLSY
jgi:lipopolysaccharide/colanic/teichoic acid biosynthesis glycosyltransferase